MNHIRYSMIITYILDIYFMCIYLYILLYKNYQWDKTYFYFPSAILIALNENLELIVSM